MPAAEPPPGEPDIYDLEFVERLFDDMAGTYEAMNYITSFGFSRLWRRQFVQRAKLAAGMTVCDWMCGMGECWSGIAAGLQGRGRILAFDLSTAMLKRARGRVGRHPGVEVEVFKQDVLHSGLPDASVDCVLAAFGLKTFSPEQQRRLGREMHRVLKPGGTFSLIEVSSPEGWSLRPLYMFYLKRCIPLLGRLFLGDPHTYRMLGVYTERFGDCTAAGERLAESGLQVHCRRYFYGCATGLDGFKCGETPAEPA